jgi:hypothetical protein
MYIVVAHLPSQNSRTTVSNDCLRENVTENKLVSCARFVTENDAWSLSSRLFPVDP